MSEIVSEIIENSTPTAIQNLRTVKTTCAYCGVGCGVVASIDDSSRTVSVVGDPDHPANFGKLCSKGKALGDTLDLDRRLAHPLIHGKQVDWDTATDFIAQQFAQTIAEHGADSVMLYVSGQLLTEDYYVANKFTKGFLGTNNLDSNSRLCMSSAVAGYKRAFGSDTVPCSYSDIEDSELFVIIGSNMAWCHPILFGRLKAAKTTNPAKKIVVIDPRVTDSVAIADVHLPIRAGTDTHLFTGLLNYLHTHGYANADYLAHCNNLDETLESAKYWTVEKVAQVCGVSIEPIETFYQLFATTDKTVSFYSMGVNQSSNGTDKVNSIINCHLYTGKMGYAGAGAFSITGQPNAMGGREVGALGNLLTAHFELKNSNHRQTVADFWQTSHVISPHDGIKATQCADAILEGQIKAIWIIATNPVVSLPEADKFALALKTCPLVIVSDCSKDSDTLDFAHVKLPAQGWSEKSGTVTNSERRISRQRRLVTPFSEARPDWWIISQVAQKMGFHGFAYRHESQVFGEFARLTGLNNDHAKSRSFNISQLADISQEKYDTLQPFQWGKKHYFGLKNSGLENSGLENRNLEHSDLEHSDLEHSHLENSDLENNELDGDTPTLGTLYTDTQKLHFVAVTPAVPKSLPSPEYPYTLNTGRLRDQWHTMTRTGIAPQLNQHLPQPFIAIHPDDAQLLGIEPRDFVKVTSPHGSILLRADITPKQRAGDVFVPMHWNNHFTANARVGTLLTNYYDPYSQQPELKHQPVKLSTTPMYAFARLLINKGSDDKLLTYLDDPAMSYWVRNRQENSSDYLLAITPESRLKNDWFSPDFWQNLLPKFLSNATNSLAFITFQSKTPNQQSYDYRLAIMAGDSVQAVVFVNRLESQLPSFSWLDSLFGQTLDSNTRKWLLAGKPATGFVDVGRIICSCMTVGENTLIDTIQTYDCKTASEVGKYCKAGTNCGSCVSEINRLLSEIDRSSKAAC